MSAAAAAKVPFLAAIPLLRRAAVLGAGAMGSRIAAHLANAGVPVLLLDIVPPNNSDPKIRSSIATSAVAALLKAKPAAFYDAASARLITPGNFEDDLAGLKECDWIIEAVTEDLAIKQALLAKIIPHLGPASIVTTNTSGLPVASIAANTTPEFRHRWFGTHFFNPPRYMRLLEIIPTPEADPTAISTIAAFADRRLGKSIVYARDTPNFIANRIGVFSMLTAVRLMREQNLTIEDVDALTGSVIGWPRTGTFRLADMVGIDVLAHVARNFAESRGTDASATTLPEFIETMLERRWLGDKSGQGFYKKDPQAKDPRNNRLALDWHTLEYRAAGRPKFPSVEMAKNAGVAPGAPAPGAGRRCKEGQSRCFSFSIAHRYLELCRRLPAGDRGFSRLHRPRHAHRVQLGAGPIRNVGCRRSGRNDRTASRRWSACEPAGGSAARCRQNKVV